jgi:hypothetical protein
MMGCWGGGWGLVTYFSLCKAQINNLPMTLIEEIENRQKEITTDGYPMSIGELISLYREDELDIHPEFQRFFRWSPLQKTKLIESILLGIPIPSIFVSQRQDGVWDVVDGLQRLSTIFEFVGILRDENGNLLPPSTLLETSYLPSLKDKMWDKHGDDANSFDQSLRLTFKREKIDVKIVKKESDASIKYELFQRLNTLGSKLSDQEVRNCLLVMLNKDFYQWLKDLSVNESFINTLVLTDKAIEEQYNMELALRYFILKKFDPNEIKNKELGEYLTEKMLELCNDKTFDFETEAAQFKKTFEILDFSMSEMAFKRYNLSKTRFEGKFILSAFEVISVGLGRNIQQYIAEPLNGRLKQNIEDKIKAVWADPKYQDKSGSGVRANFRIPVIVPLGQHIFAA